MTYTVFLLPNTCYYYPRFIIQLVQSENDSAFVITLDKKHMESLCPNAYYLERSYGENGEKTVSNSKIMNKIQKKEPTLVLLDDCFWEANAELINELYKLRSEMNFKLVNVMQMHSAKYSKNIARLRDADCIFAPSWKKDLLRTCDLPDGLSFYNEDELYRIWDKKNYNEVSHNSSEPNQNPHPYSLFWASEIDSNSHQNYIRKYGNFSHVLNITIHDSINDPREKQYILSSIYKILNEKVIEKNIFDINTNIYTNVRIKWRVYDDNYVLQYFTDVGGIFGDKAVQEHTKLVLQEIHKHVNKDMFSIHITKPVTKYICMV